MTSKDNLFSVKDKNILILGGSSQILSEFIKYCLEQGANVSLTSRESEKLEHFKEINSDKLILKALNPLDEHQLEVFSKELLSKWKKIDALVCAVGAGTRAGDLDPNLHLSSIDLNGWRESFELNLFSAITAAKFFASEMIDNPAESVAICIGSVSVQNILSKVGAYGAAKAALEKTWKELGQYAAERRKILNYEKPMSWRILQPGFFPAEQNKRFLLNPDGSPTLRGEQMLKRTPFAKFGSSHDLVRPLVSMLFPEFQTMDVVSVSGGFNSDLPY